MAIAFLEAWFAHMDWLIRVKGHSYVSPTWAYVYLINKEPFIFRAAICIILIYEAARTCCFWYIDNVFFPEAAFGLSRVWAARWAIFSRVWAARWAIISTPFRSLNLHLMFPLCCCIWRWLGTVRKNVSTQSLPISQSVIQRRDFSSLCLYTHRGVLTLVIGNDG